MNIFIMRHGEAEVMANSDKARRLTAYGIKQAFSQGEWLKQHLSTLVINSLDRILVSPYVRAQETFHQVNQAFDFALENSVETWEGITPYGYAHSVIDYLEVLKDEGPAKNFSATTETVEVLKGPASVLYGIQDPGGVVNIILSCNYCSIIMGW